MKRSAPWLLAALVLAGCTSLDSIPYSPTQTSETWLKIQPFIEFQVASKTIILVQPSTTVIVTFLGIVAIAAGLYFLRLRNDQKSRYLVGRRTHIVGRRGVIRWHELRSIQLSNQMCGTSILPLDQWVGNLLSGVFSEQRGCHAGRCGAFVYDRQMA